VKLLLTGRPGCGKTTVVLRFLAAMGRGAGGFYTEEWRSGGARAGFALITTGVSIVSMSSMSSAGSMNVSTGCATGEPAGGAMTGARGVLAWERHQPPPAAASPHRAALGRYVVDVGAVERLAVPAVLAALADARVTCVVIDEIARMELMSAEFRRAVTAALDGPKAVLATIRLAPDPFCDALKRRAGVKVIEVTGANRDRLPSELAARLGGRQTGG
jgi:nucleoside-triphosphatase